jgi:hypothetical protein
MAKLDPVSVLSKLTQAITPIIRNRIGEDCCVLSTRVAIEVLRQFRIRASALPVAVCVYNRAFLDRQATEGRLPRSLDEIERWHRECGAHSIGTANSRPASRGLWNGHLVAIVNGLHLMDPSVGQMSRPQYGIFLPPTLVTSVKKPFLQGREGVGIDFVGCRLTYELDRSPTATKYQEALDWRRSNATLDLIEGVVTALKRS